MSPSSAGNVAQQEHATSYEVIKRDFYLTDIPAHHLLSCGHSYSSDNEKEYKQYTAGKVTMDKHAYRFDGLFQYCCRCRHQREHVETNVNIYEKHFSVTFQHALFDSIVDSTHFRSCG